MEGFFDCEHDLKSKLTLFIILCKLYDIFKTKLTIKYMSFEILFTMTDPLRNC